MALNFPSDTSRPYVDPVSGLKYLWNNSIGAWESAIQPPVVITQDAHPPNIDIDGFLWWNLQAASDVSQLYIKLDGNWEPVSTNDTDIKAIVFSGPTPPANPVDGTLWWDSVSGQLYVWYVDQDSSQWVEASPSNTVAYSQVVVSATEPLYPKSGTLWYNLNDDKMYIYLYDPNTGLNQWNSLSNGSTFRSRSVPAGNVTTDPTGNIITFASGTAPDGYLLCDGSMVNIADYQNLFDVIGNTYNTGTHQTKFRLPNLDASSIHPNLSYCIKF